MPGPKVKIRSKIIEERQEAYVPIPYNVYNKSGNVFGCRNDIRILMDHNTDDRNLPLFAKYQAVEIRNITTGEVIIPKPVQAEREDKKGSDLS